jgi:transposase
MGAAVEITRTEYTSAELRGLGARCSDGAQVRRLLALALVLDGYSRTEAAALSGMDRQTLPDWVHRYNAAGIDGLKSLRAPGRAPALTEARKAELRELVIQGPDPAIHQVVRWRRVDLRAEAAFRKLRRPGQSRAQGRRAPRSHGNLVPGRSSGRPEGRPRLYLGAGRLAPAPYWSATEPDGISGAKD